MLFSYNEGTLYTAWEVRENGMFASVHLGSQPYDGSMPEDIKKFLHGFEVHLSGKNPAENHGYKHHGGSGTHTLKYKSHEEFPHPDGHELAVTLKDESIAYVQHFRFYTGIGVMRAWVEVTNISDKPVGLEYVASLSLSGACAGGEQSPNENLRVLIPHNTWKREVNWKEHTLSALGMNGVYDFIGVNRIAVSNSGTWSTKEYLPMGGLQNIETNCTLLWQIEHNGSFHWEIGETNAPNHLYLKLSGPTDQEHGWYKELIPGESFVTVPVAIAAAADFDGALAELTKYRRAIRRACPAGDRLPIIFNDYMDCLRTKPTTENEKPVIDRAAAVGAEYYVVDAGWYADASWWNEVGNWQESKNRFPGGFREVTDYIREKGMVPGLWIEPEVMGIECPILDQFDDSCFFMRHGRRVIDHGRYQLDLRSPKVRKFLDDTVDRLIRDYGLGYMKFDYNIDAGRGTETNADSAGDGLLSHNRAYLAWVEGLMDRHPDVVFENCSCGGMRTDWAQLARFSLQSTSDQEDYRGRAYIARAATTALLPEQAGTWSCPLETQDTDAIVFNMVNTIPLRPYMCGRAWLWSEEQQALIKEGLDCHKSLRYMIPEAITFFPQGVPSYDDGWLCVGYRGAGRTVMPVWRTEGEEASYTIPVEGYAAARVLYPKKTDTQIKVEDGKLTVTLPRKNMAVLLELE